MLTLKSITTALFILAVPTLAFAKDPEPSVVVASIAPMETSPFASNEERLDQVREWILGFMTKAAPPGRKVYYPEGQETPEEASVRYKAVANDIIRVVYNPHTKPLFPGPNGRARTVSVILSIMLHESAFMRHVDFGLGKYGKGDSGQSWCSMQIKIGTGRTMKWNVKHDRPIAWNDPKDEISEGVTGEELVANRQLCISEGLKILRVSFGGTKGLPIDDRLRVYASGDRDKGADASHNRMRTAMMFFSTSSKARTFTDAEVMEALDKDRLEVFIQGLPSEASPVL
jgi:hypothetical protein